MLTKKQIKTMIDWMYSKDNPNHEYNKKTYGPHYRLQNLAHRSRSSSI